MYPLAMHMHRTAILTSIRSPAMHVLPGHAYATVLMRENSSHMSIDMDVLKHHPYLLI